MDTLEPASAETRATAPPQNTRTGRSHPAPESRAASSGAPFHGGRGFFDGIQHSRVRSAPAKIVVHVADNLLARRLRRPRQQGVSTKNHPRCAETALEGVMLHKRLLDGVQMAIPVQAFDREHLFTGDIPDRG